MRTAGSGRKENAQVSIASRNVYFFLISISAHLWGSICFNFGIRASGDDYTLPELGSELPSPDEELPQDTSSEGSDIEVSYTSGAGNEFLPVPNVCCVLLDR